MQETNFLRLKSGKRLCFAEYGDPEGIPVMYFHGWPSSRLQGRQIHEVCLEKGVRLVAPDRPGVGKSDFVEGRKLGDWPQVVEELADHLGFQRFGVIGVSGGGPYALAVAHWLPERLTKVEVVVGAPPLAEFSDRSEMVWPYRILLALRPKVPWALPVFLKMASWISKFEPDEVPMKWVLSCVSAADREEIGHRGSFADLTRSFREGLAQGAKGVTVEGDLYSADWELDFRAIRVPVTFWHGEDDRNIPFAMVKELASWVPGAEKRFFPGEGHYSVALRKATEVVESVVSGSDAGRNLTCVS